MEDIIYNSIADYMNDEDFMYTLSTINKSQQISNRRKRILSKYSATILNELMINIKNELNIYKSLKEAPYNDNIKQDIFFELLYNIQNELLISTSINQFGKNNEYCKNYNLPVKHVFYPYARSIIRTPLNQVKAHFDNMENEIRYSRNICPIYRVGPFERRLLKKFPTVRALIY